MQSIYLPFTDLNLDRAKGYCQVFTIDQLQFFLLHWSDKKIKNSISCGHVRKHGGAGVTFLYIARLLFIKIIMLKTILKCI